MEVARELPARVLPGSKFKSVSNEAHILGELRRWFHLKVLVFILQPCRKRCWEAGRCLVRWTTLLGKHAAQWCVLMAASSEQCQVAMGHPCRGICSLRLNFQ